MNDGLAQNREQCMQLGNPIVCCVGARCAPSERQLEYHGDPDEDDGDDRGDDDDGEDDDDDENDGEGDEY